MLTNSKSEYQVLKNSDSIKSSCLSSTGQIQVPKSEVQNLIYAVYFQVVQFEMPNLNAKITTF